MPQRTPVDGGVGLAAEINRDRIEQESAARFRFFFVALVFAILSFAIQFPIHEVSNWLKAVEASSWVCIAFTGLIALGDIGGFDIVSKLGKKYPNMVWISFLLGIALLLVSKIWALFLF